MEYTLQIDIAKPIDEVTNLFGEAENLPFWQPGFVGFEELSPSESGLARCSLRYLNRGKEIEMIETVLEDDLPNQYAAQYQAEGMLMEVRNSFEAIDPNTTRIISENRAEVSGVLMKLITLLVPGMFKKQSLSYLENFKAFAETGADVRKTKK